MSNNNYETIASIGNHTVMGQVATMAQAYQLQPVRDFWCDLKMKKTSELEWGDTSSKEPFLTLELQLLTDDPKKTQNFIAMVTALGAVQKKGEAPYVLGADSLTVVLDKIDVAMEKAPKVEKFWAEVV